MPLVRISLNKSHSGETKNNISVAIHNSLMDAFKIPEDDIFHIIEELEHHQMKYPKKYLGIEHSSNIVFIQVVAIGGRTVQQKKELYELIAKRIAQTTEITPNDIIISLIDSVEVSNWSFGNGEMFTPKPK